MLRMPLATTAILTLVTLTACFESPGATFVMYDLVTVDGTPLPAQSSTGAEITRGILTLFGHDESFSLGITVVGQGGADETTWSRGVYVDSDSAFELTITSIDGTQLDEEIVLSGVRSSETIEFHSEDGDEYVFRKWRQEPSPNV